MICPECGHRNAPDTAFCTSCETFLEWGDPQQSEGGDAGRDTPGGPGRPQPEPSPVTPHGPQTAEAGARPDERTGQDGQDGQGSQGSQGSQDQRAGQERQRGQTPAGPRRPGDRLDAPVPGPPEDPPEQPPGPALPPPLSRGAVRCPNCRTENAAERVLCLRCGLLLDPGPPPDVPPPWWRRILGRRRRSLPAAGARPKRRLWRRPSLAIPITLAVLVCAAWFARPYLSEAYDFARDRTATPEELRPSQVRGSSAMPDHPARAAFDTYTNRYWVPAEAGPGIGEFLECEFEKPVRVLKLAVFAGRSANGDAFLSQARPAALTVTMRSADGEVVDKRITLKDQPGQQTFDIRGAEVVQVRLTVDDVYGDREGRRPAIAEIDFFGRR
ncbi:zinc ribbon domain-containing protein [Streptomyces sp. NPDC058200]|uniref:zinc ribbon domain-containing protein n=1 Tax=Streptomyces sp. NPDC058200 TaxID=3346378 RepID=UPI0036EDDE69